ncbi:tyrosine-type recombinase/integrase [Cohnella silvisoli]|uniref:Site-specific integrase n=1 Tax=Cohnella silvisoli TaxID=2873699 RepID=A0ABV1KQZ0_9BACL|nr:site-specific integrase [Cohnella silvisoli]MCD9025596.1 site-specific integrase [Cohnella silvisoli]
MLPQKLSFTTFLLDWLNNVIKNNVETITWESYELVITKHSVPYMRTQLNDIPLHELQPIHLQRYYEFKLASGLSGNTLRKHHANIKSASSYRSLPLMEKIKEYLEIIQERQKQNKKLYGNDYAKSGFVCCWPNGSPLKSEYLNHKFKQLLSENDLPPIRFHDLRHSIASYLLKHGMSLKEIQVWLGHADIGTTANIYSHVDTEMKKNTAQKIHDLFSKNKSKQANPAKEGIEPDE